MSTGSSHTPKNKGFALLITITLLAFLVLLLVSLAALTRVETQVASNNQQLAQARQNALMALNIALGELQKYTGPDQRTTARSDILNTTSPTNYTAPSGRWIGAYGSGAAADYTQSPSALSTTITTASDARGSQAKLLNWLVSGNENTAFNPASDVGTTGNITNPPASFLFRPGDPTNTAVGTLGGLTVSSTAVDNITIKDKNNIAQPARLLVGANTVGASLVDYVVAPLKEIPAVAQGLGTSDVTVGRYAWWVGDEGAKARVNLPIATVAQNSNAFVSAQRTAVELVDAIHASSATTLSDTAMLNTPNSATPLPYSPSDIQLQKLLSAAQLPMLSASSATALRTAIQYRYHDLTASSTSVLSDTYAGGLKKDLSAVLALGATSPADTEFIFPPEPNSGSQTNEFGMPTWGLLRSHVQTVSSASGGLTPRPPGMVKLPTRQVPIPSTVGVSPVLTYATVGFAFGVPLSAPAPADSVGNPIHLGVFPVVVLWNPYTTDLKASKYEVGFHKTYSGQFELQATTTPASWSITDVIKTKSLETVTSSSDPFLRFIIDSPVIPAGQSLIFTLPDSANEQPYVPPSTTPPYSATPLTNGWHHLNHLLMPNPNIIDVAGKTYRVGVNGGTTPMSGVPRTYFGNTIYNFGGNDAAECYLGAPGYTPPTGPMPYKSTSGNPSQGWHQSVTLLLTYYNDAPYGTNQGYSRATGTHGLFRQPGAIDIFMEPTFRMSFRATFQNSMNRWIAQANPRAPMLSRPGSGGLVNWTLHPGNGSWPNDLQLANGSINSSRASSGVSLNYATSTPVDVTLFEFRPDTQPLLSIGQLQHANLAWLSGYPSYAIGNSLGDPFLAGTPSQVMKMVTFPSWGDQAPATKSTAYYDLSWLLNRALWDRYFISTVPHAGTGTALDTNSSPIPTELPNPRNVRYGSPNTADLRDPDRAAANLMLTGGFNINSTSEQAWRAVLGGVNQLPYDPVIQGSGTPLKAALSRFSKPTAPQPAAVNSTTAWTGYRVLTEIQIAQLAKNIVDEIRKRGPSISLADFINRRLADDGIFPVDNDKRIKGTIQAALDATTAITGTGAINKAADAPFSGPLVAESFNAAVTNVFKAGNALGGAPAVAAPYSSTSAFAPQFLTQADILSTIGSGLSGRSDTFTIRTYGEVTNPALTAADAGYITARAWCEAVVQRLPEYVDTTTAAYNPPTAGSNNQKFGRRFKVISFQWLSAKDI